MYELLLNMKYQPELVIHRTASGEAPESEKEKFDRELNYETIKHYMQTSKRFEIDERIKKLLMLTDPPKLDNELLKLPFPSIFIDTSFTKEEYKIDSNNLEGLLIVPHKVDEIREGHEIKADMFIVYNVTREDKKIWLNTCVITTKANTKVSHLRTLPQDYKLIKQFLFNFLLFLNQPEVKIKEVERTQKNIERRIRQGKVPLPPKMVISLTGYLNDYINKIEQLERSGFSYSHRFWVRGHFRTLRSPRWKEKVGMRIWIPPFIKGQGQLLNKSYSLHRNEGVVGK